MRTEEPTDVYPEDAFQSAIVALSNEILAESGQRFILLEGFGLDIAIFIAAQTGTIVRLIEAKSFNAQRMGGVGFGNGSGQGAQVDMLLAPDNCLPLLTPLVRWVLVDATQPSGSNRYCLFSCAKAKSAAMGGVARNKQNNLRISGLRDDLVDWQTLGIQLQQFLLGAANMTAAR